MSRFSVRPAISIPLVGAVLLVTLLVDRLVLLPSFEAGGGGISTAAKVVVWLLVNSPPAVASALLARSSGARIGAIAAALGVAVITGLGILLALYSYIAAEGGLA